ncbi:MAG: PEP-CTERM sorting domain-containing protein [Oryzomonas sp.]|uniref:PEP-CTERM sorting domain-containing protein n=1 Tax=Oryzomonas sp. TaxID=2855186 RepID=UPI0028497F72|nr:PEP-CTERM sorting domain-containing protein [Oryzomonas sp.]MDR3578504.1 PEP-CTERM sorting domain-containing protein [Oryzomonas sp.]
MKKMICSIAALLLFGMVGGASATSYTLTDNDTATINGSSGTAFTVSGTSTATSTSTFESATLTVYIDITGGTLTAADFSSWFDSARALGYTEQGATLTNVGGEDYKLVFAPVTNLAYFGNDNTGSSHWYGSSLVMGIADDCQVALDSESLTVNYTNTAAPVPEPGTMMLLGIGMLGLAVYGKRRMNTDA